MLRRTSLCLALAALAACSRGPRPPLAFATAQAAAQQVCASPASHREILTAVRALNWTPLGPDGVPDRRGADAVKWSEVVMSPGQDMVVAVGRLSGTSFCHVYARQAQPAQADLERAQVLGAPLGAPNFHQRIDGRDVTGWHRRTGKDWRAVHLSISGPTTADRMPLMIEMTRAAT